MNLGQGGNHRLDGPAMKKLYTVELTSDQIAFLIRWVDWRITDPDTDSTRMAHAITDALVAAQPKPDSWQILARNELRRLNKKPVRATATAIGRHPLRKPEREKAQ